MIIEYLILFFFAHALCDYPLQGDFLAKAKNRTAPIPGAPWWQALSAHAAIHAGAVFLISQLWWMALIEFAAHFLIDDAKCSGRIGFNTDQALHIGLKIGFVMCLVWLT
jgi:hypothetical protein